MKAALISLLSFLMLSTGGLAGDDQRLAVMDEKLDRLRALIEEVQFKQQEVEKKVADLQTQPAHVRKTSDASIAALDARLKELEAAASKDGVPHVPDRPAK